MGDQGTWPTAMRCDDLGAESVGSESGPASTRPTRLGSRRPISRDAAYAGAQKEDVELLLAHLAGDVSAFTRLVGRHDPRLRSLCKRYLNDPAAVDDIIQETFCRVLTSTHRIDHQFNVGAWIQRIALNLCIDELRRRNRWMAGPSSDHQVDLLGILDGDRSYQPEDALELDATRRQIYAAIMQLTAVQRDVLVLRDVRGLSEARTAEILGIRTGAVQGILHRARDRFRNTFAGQSVDKGPRGSCAQVAFVFENLQIGALRKDRLHALERHLESCDWCRSTFATRLRAAVQRADRGAAHPDASPQVFAA